MLERKPNPLGKLLNLPDEAKEKLRTLLESGLDYHRAVPLIKKEFGVVTSVGAVQNFWDKYVAPLRLLRRSRAAQLSSMLGKEVGKNPVDWDTALDDSLKELAFETMQIPGIDPEKVFFLMQCVYKAKDQTLKGKQIRLSERRLELLEKRETKTKQALSSSKLSPQEKLEKINEIFGKVA